MACDAMAIPKLKFPRNYIIEIVPASYQNHARRVLIDGIDTSSLTAPNSPDDTRMQAGATSGVVSPMVQLDPMGALSIGGSSTPLPSAGATTPVPSAASSTLLPSAVATMRLPSAAITPIPSAGANTPVVIEEPAEIDESNVVGKESDF